MARTGELLGDSVGQRRFTVEEYHRMSEIGIFERDERVELIRGVVHRMSPKNDAHIVSVAKVVRLLNTVLAGRASIYPEAPLKLVGLDSEPEPDIVVTSSAVIEDYSKALPVLVIEVSESSLRHDMNTKAPLYAEAGVPEYWIVNLVDRSSWCRVLQRTASIETVTRTAREIASHPSRGMT